MIYRIFFKRFFDILLSALALIVLSPVFLILTILVRAKLGSPAIFRQERPGKNGRIFTLYKFRSMTDAVDDDGTLRSDEERLTPFGKKLRSTSLDELPELWNIFKGDMSIVGPRPLLVEYLPLYDERQRRRHEVRPGLTGLAQVNGRNALSWEEKFALDVEYVDHISFLEDVKIILQTVKIVMKHEGISAEGEATMTKFAGSSK